MRLQIKHSDRKIKISHAFYKKIEDLKSIIFNPLQSYNYLALFKLATASNTPNTIPNAAAKRT